jgi:hypothetical protein
MNDRPLNEYTTIIRSGVTPAPEGTGRLSPERARALDEDLKALRLARARALVEAMTYMVGGAS